MWIKVWTNWAWGDTKKSPTYHEIANAGPSSHHNEANELTRGIDDDHEWSDKYRGAEYEIIDFPPPAFVEQLIVRLRENAAHDLSRADDLQRQLLAKRS